MEKNGHQFIKELTQKKEKAKKTKKPMEIFKTKRSQSQQPPKKRTPTKSKTY